MSRKFKIVPWIGAIFETSATDDKQDLEFKDGSVMVLKEHCLTIKEKSSEDLSFRLV